MASARRRFWKLSLRARRRGIEIAEGTRVGYYRQDFSTLNFEDTVKEALMAVMDKKIEEDMRAMALRIFDKRRDYQHENRAIVRRAERTGGFRPIGLAETGTFDSG